MAEFMVIQCWVACGSEHCESDRCGSDHHEPREFVRYRFGRRGSRVSGHFRESYDCLWLVWLPNLASAYIDWVVAGTLLYSRDL